MAGEMLITFVFKIATMSEKRLLETQAWIIL